MYRAIDKWFAGWLRSRFREREQATGKRHLILSIADHFEPFRKTGDGGQGSGVSPKPEQARSEVTKWLDAYRKNMDGFEDSDGRAPCHTFFYPAEEYDEGCLERLAEFTSEGLGEVEIQLHHRNDTPEGFKKKVATFKEQLRRLGFLGVNAEGKRMFGFVHGNWSLCNSRPDGDWCGVNEELALLQSLGCYADFTFPSAPSPTQPRMVNCIYRAVDTPGKPRSADSGSVMQASKAACSDGVEAVPPEQLDTASGLPIITGPLGLRWQGMRPRLENSALTSTNPPSRSRLSYWLDTGISVRGKPDWIFVKLHMHGMTELDGDLITDGLPALHRELQHIVGSGEWDLHYASAREMYNIARAAEMGKDGSPNEWRDYEISKPECVK